jgi:hypothetical protein
VYDDEWRVEVELDDEEHGYGLGERLRSHDLDEEARVRLPGRVIVTRDGSRIFLYTASEQEAREAERVVRKLATADELTAEISVTRWHPVEEDWKDASIPLPQSEAEIDAERRRHEEAERAEAKEEGSYDWWVKVELHDRGAAADLAEKLASEGLPVHRRWRYLTVDVLTEEQANELGTGLLGELPPEAEVWVEANPDDVPNPVFVLLESRL